ncbi:MAG: hypothetical protein ACLTE2_12335 [Eubacteriales bacterium]
MKKIKKICISCLLTLCMFIPNIAVLALNIPSDNIAVQSILVDGIQVTNTPSMVEQGTGFFMNDGSVAICCSHGLPAPSQGVGYYIETMDLDQIIVMVIYGMIHPQIGRFGVCTMLINWKETV